MLLWLINFAVSFVNDFHSASTVTFVHAYFNSHKLCGRLTGWLSINAVSSWTCVMTDFCGNSVGTHFCSCKNDACAAPVRSVWLSVSERARSGASLNRIALSALCAVLLYIYVLLHAAAGLWMSLMQKGSRIISSGSCEFAIHEKCCCWMHTQPHCISWAWNCFAVFKDVLGSMGES